METRILHLSDIHLGNDTEVYPYEIDDKIGLFKKDLAHMENNFDILCEYLSNLKTAYDYVVFSGDIVHQGKSDKSLCFYNTVLRLIKAKKFPKENHIIIVPGNHDIVKGTDRWRIFKQYSDIQFVKPIMNFGGGNECFQEVRKKLKSRSNYISDSELPLIIDKTRKIIFYAFNSCSLCQMENVSINGKNDSLDLPRIDNWELNYFTNIMQTFKEIDDDYDNYLKIAVMHHHIASFTEFEEIKSFEMLSNAGIVKKKLIENGFKLVLHGHKHYPSIYLDTTVGEKSGIAVISGGAICEKINREGRKQGFFDLLYDSDRPDELSERYIELSIAQKSYDAIPFEKIELPHNRNYIRKRREIDVVNINRLVSEGLEKNFIKQDNMYGWDKKVLDKKKIGIIGTAIGIIINEMLDGYTRTYIYYKENIVDSLYSQKKENGGFGVLYQSESSITATCWVAEAFKAAKRWDYYQKTIDAMLEFNEVKSREILLDSYENNTFIVAFLMRVLMGCYTTFQRDDLKQIIDECYEGLIANYLEDFSGIRWAKNLQNDKEGLIPHTCHACIALAEYKRIFKPDDKSLSDILFGAKRWLLSGRTVEFVIERIRHDKMEIVYEHTAVAWYIIALIRLGVSISEEYVTDTIGLIMEKFDWKKGFWKYNDSHKLWETYDSLLALKEYITHSVRY